MQIPSRQSSDDSQGAGLAGGGGERGAGPEVSGGSGAGSVLAGYKLVTSTRVGTLPTSPPDNCDRNCTCMLRVSDPQSLALAPGFGAAIVTTRMRSVAAATRPAHDSVRIRCSRNELASAVAGNHVQLFLSALLAATRKHGKRWLGAARIGRSFHCVSKR